MRSASPVDLSRIVHRIDKEPLYESKSPMYCLVVFGQQAKTRMWLILDGDDLYVDRNGNGNLTERGERLTPTPWRKVLMAEEQENHPTERDYIIGDITGYNGIRYADLKVNHGRYFENTVFSISTLISGKHEQVAAFLFSNRAKDAPIVHIDGPLTMELFWKDVVLGRDKEGRTLSFVVGTRGVRTFAYIDYDRIPHGAWPIASLEFPSRNPGGPPIKTQVIIDDRC